MSANSRSEAVWEVLHHAGALLTSGGFASPCPPLPHVAGRSGTVRPLASSEGYHDLAARYGSHLGFGAPWPPGEGSMAPLALVLTAVPLTEGARAFVRTWFENPRVNLVLAEDFFVQPLPELAGETPPYQSLVKDLCTLLAPKAILSLGASSAQRLLGAPLSLDTLRGSDYRFDRWSMVTTSDPEEFSTLSEDEQKRFKAQVWKDLQRLLGKLKYG